MDEMRKSMVDLQEQNKKLRKELELIKNKVSSPYVSDQRKKNENTQVDKSPEKDYRKDRKKDDRNEKSIGSSKRNSQPSVTPLRKRSQ